MRADTIKLIFNKPEDLTEFITEFFESHTRVAQVQKGEELYAVVKSNGERMNGYFVVPTSPAFVAYIRMHGEVAEYWLTESTDTMFE